MQLAQFERRRSISVGLALLFLFAMSLLVVPKYSVADTFNGQISGNFNYDMCYNPCSGTPTYMQPDDSFAWTTGGSVSSGNCFQCWSEQVQLYNQTKNGAQFNYQEILFETPKGQGTCTTNNYCNLFCIVDYAANHNFDCISQSFNILPLRHLDAAGWTEEFYVSLSNTGYITKFWLKVNGPNGFSNTFYIVDPNQAQVFSVQSDISSVGNGYGSCHNGYYCATFTAGIGTFTYQNNGYHYLMTSGTFTKEDSNMSYGGLTGNGGLTITQPYSV